MALLYKKDEDAQAENKRGCHGLGRWAKVRRKYRRPDERNDEAQAQPGSESQVGGSATPEASPAATVVWGRGCTEWSTHEDRRDH